jgi:hypothetical protein
MSAAALNTHGYRMKVGRHKDELMTRVPVSYLKWLANTPTHAEHELAKAELARRGTVTPTLEVSGHAIDNASLRLRKTWHETATSPNEGLHAWLCRMAGGALESEPSQSNTIVFRGIKFVFERDGIWPVLKTVMPA